MNDVYEEEEDSGNDSVNSTVLHQNPDVAVADNTSTDPIESLRPVEFGHLGSESLSDSSQAESALLESSSSGKHRAATSPIDEELPLMKLLKPGRKSDEDQSHEYEQARKITALFEQFGVKATVVSWKRGPRITRYEIQTGRGTRIDTISKLKDEMKYELGVSRVNILAPIPGQSYVGIEVPRKMPDIVSLRDILMSTEAQENSEPLLVAMGEDVDGSAVLSDIADMPHLLVAGATGSGKSCFINSLICSILLRSTPDQVRLVLIDPKRVEFAQFKDVPHLALPVISEPAVAIEALAWAVAQMESRYAMFERHRVNRIERYNSQSLVLHERYPDDPTALPRIVVIVDELADLMQTTNREVEALIVRLSQQGRAAGIHLVVATQRPSVNVITGIIKANISSRLAFATASQVDSRVILDAVGAENLSGQGDGILMLNGIDAPRRIQGALVDEDEISDVVNFVRHNANAPLIQYVWQPKHLSVKDQGNPDEVRQERDQDADLKVSSAEPKDYLSSAIGEVRVLSEDNLDTEPQRTSTMIEFEEFTEPDWHDIVGLLERRIEPCDITGAMVDVSRKRKLWRSIERSISSVRVRVVQRLADRSEFRFKDRIDQDEAVSQAQASLAEWTHEHSHSVAWKFHAQAIAEVQLAQDQRKQAIELVTGKVSFRNEEADRIYATFVKGTLLPILILMYGYSVLVLTDKRFHSILKYFPPFNQGLTVLGVMISGITSVFLFKAMWSYTEAVRETQWRFIETKKAYEEAILKITHAYEEQVRLEQQVASIEPLLEVLSRGYGARWVIDDSLNVDVSTHLDTSRLPACVGFARAVNGPDDQVAQLQDLALRQVVKPGWRTEIIKQLGEQFGEKSKSPLTFFQLDQDLGFSTAGARNKFLAAFEDVELAKRIGKTKLFDLVNIIHNLVLREASTNLRPPVRPARLNGFEQLDTSSAWLDERKDTENWLDYLAEILQEAPEFSYLGLSSIGKSRRMSGKMQSYAVIPKYLFGKQHASVMTESNSYDQIAPIDVAIRVDVSEWADLASFGVFEPDQETAELAEPQDSKIGGMRG